MKTFDKALQEGFTHIPDLPEGQYFPFISESTADGYWSFKFGDNDEYELCFESLLFDNQYYVALYKNKSLLTEKVVIKPGYIKGGDIE